jgi:Response regulator containing CheY-like receiver, AAA-type ATPase, and DNA-binding domains
LTEKNPVNFILDYTLPDMDGISVLKEVRKVNKKIPVIMFTAHPDAQAMAEAEKLGISTFIPKISPYSDAQSSLREALKMIEKKLLGSN